MFQRFLLPGFVFQSVVIAGGYGTGREIVEFFLTLGPRGGLAAMAVATVIWSVVCAVSYDFARHFRAQEYQTFFRELIGPFGPLYEVTWYAFMLLVLAVVAAAAGSILEGTFGLNYWVGVIGMTALIGFLVFLGTKAIERVLAAWSFVLYAVFVVMFVWAIVRFGPEISAALAGGEGGAVAAGASDTNWVLGGIQYAGYNLAIIPALLFSIRHIRTRGEAIGAGLLAGPIAMIPAFLFFVAMVALYPGIVDVEVPANTVLEALGSRPFQVAFQVMLFGTLVETGTGMIHSVNERIANALTPEAGAEDAPPTERFSQRARAAVALTWLVAAATIAQFGLIDLIARGYGTMTWVFIAIYVVPILTIGVWKLYVRGEPARAA